MKTTESIRRAICDAISQNPNKVSADAIALQMGVSRATVYRWGEDSGVDIPLGRLVQLISITGDHRPLSALCEILGGTFLPVPRRERGEKLDIRALKEFSEFLQARIAALADGKVNAVEAAHVRKGGVKAITTIALAMADVELAYQED